MKKIILTFVLLSLFFFIIHNIYYKPPFFYIALTNFYFNKESLNQVHYFMVNNKKIHEILLVPDSNFVEAENENHRIIKLDEEIQGKLGESLLKLRTIWVTKKEWGWLYFSGGGVKFNMSFYISYVFRTNKKVEMPSCDSESNYEVSGHGAYHIEDNWYLDYEWYPLQPRIIIEQEVPWPPNK